jgi:hypothetical protein
LTPPPRIGYKSAMMRASDCKVWNWIVAGLGIALTLTGCASFTPKQQQSAEEIRTFIADTARVYAVPRIYVLVGNDVSNIGGTYRRGMITVSTGMLASRHRDSLIAHELAHYLLGHDAPLSGSTALDQAREQEVRELEANAKAVEILTRVTARSEEQALRLVYDHLAAFNRMITAGRSVVPWGHRHPCEEIHDLLARFPAQRRWSATLDCASETTAAAGTLVR